MVYQLLISSSFNPKQLQKIIGFFFNQGQIKLPWILVIHIRVIVVIRIVKIWAEEYDKYAMGGRRIHSFPCSRD